MKENYKYPVVIGTTETDIVAHGWLAGHPTYVFDQYGNAVAKNYYTINKVIQSMSNGKKRVRYIVRVDGQMRSNGVHRYREALVFVKELAEEVGD